MRLIDADSLVGELDIAINVMIGMMEMFNNKDNEGLQMELEAYRDIRDGIKREPTIDTEQKTGKWILDRSGAYCCSECMEPCAGYVMMKPRDRFCKMCGAKMEDEHDG